MSSIVHRQVARSLTGPPPPDTAVETGSKEAESSRMLSKSIAMGRAYAIAKSRINAGIEELCSFDGSDDTQL